VDAAPELLVKRRVVVAVMRLDNAVEPRAQRARRAGVRNRAGYFRRGAFGPASREKKEKKKRKEIKK
jgi:hypothetical protein